jgi:acyl-CoA synthetase (NDP forming)/RimJ/RimL family protein N-acetyltransferase
VNTGLDSEARDVLLADGGTACIRPLRNDDVSNVRHLYEASSVESRYLRFFTPVAVDAAVRLTAPPADDEHHCTLVAEIGGRLVALAQYDADDERDAAEVAFIVEDAHQGRGIGTILLESLVQRAASHGIRRFHAEFLRQNRRMADVLTHSGFEIRWAHDDGDLGGADFELVPTEQWADAHAQRVEIAQAHSIARVLTPRSIAVVGAGRHAGSIGRAILDNLAAGEFTGVIHPVNSRATTIAGRRAWPSVLDIPGLLDLAVIAVPAAEVLDVARQCAAKNVAGLVVISGGFAELGAADVQDELTRLCRRASMRLVGPNCVGVVNTDPDIRMNATFSPAAPVIGRVGFASQSGGVGIELLSRAHALGLGVSTFVSMGNKADVSANDLMQYWAEDDATDVVLLYLESFGNPQKFARVARHLARRKPVVALKSGRTIAGARGTRSHTAALTDPDAAVDTLLRQTGVIRVATLEELFDVGALLAHQPVPVGRRVAVVSNGGGPAIVAADACVAAGLDVPELSTELQVSLRELAPSGGVENPVDLGASAGASVFERATLRLLASGEVDALLVIYVAPYVTRAEDVEEAVARAASCTDDIPVAACVLGLDDVPATLPMSGSSRAVPIFTYPESAVRALADAAWLGEWRRQSGGTVMQCSVAGDRARSRVGEALSESPRGLWAPVDVTFGLLSDYGIPVVATAHASSATEAATQARELGFPVAIKAGSPELVHKSDVGGVRLGLTSERAVRRAFAEMHAALGASMGGAIVQPMVPTGVELIVGINHDPTFGPLVLFGMGGFAAELQHDVALAVPPFTDVDVDRLIRSLRGSPLLFGFRNSQPVDTDALADVLGRIGQLAEEIDEIAELDCNPLVASGDGVLVVDAKLRLVTRPEKPSPFPLD